MKPGQLRSPSLVAMAVLAALAAACGGTSPTTGGGGGGSTSSSSASAVYNQLNSAASGKARQLAYQMAKKEGSLSLYTSLTSDVASAVQKAFEKQFPGVKMTVFRANSETVLQRVLQETSANRTGNDAVETNFLEMSAMSDKGLLAKYQGAQLQQVDPKGRFANWTADRYNLFLPAWNTNIIKPGQEPKSWEDLASPRFNGKLTMEVSDYDWFAALSLYWAQQGKSQQQIANLWKQIVQGAKVAKGHTTMMELLGAGQSGVDAMNYSYITQRAKNKGAPVAYRSANGKAGAVAFPRPNGVAMMKAAKNPAAAWLFYDWMLSDGQKVLVQQELTPSTKVAGDTSLQGITLGTFPVQELSKNSKTWSDRYDALLRGVPQQPGSGSGG